MRTKYGTFYSDYRKPELYCAVPVFYGLIRDPGDSLAQDFAFTAKSVRKRDGEFS